MHPAVLLVHPAIYGKRRKSPSEFFLEKKLSSLSLSPALASSSSFVGRFSFFCFILVLHSSASFCIFFGLLLLRAASSSSVFFFAFLLLPHLRCRHCCRDQVEASSLRCCFFFEFLLLLRGTFLLRLSSSSTIVAGDGGNRHREVAGQFTDHLIRKPLPDHDS